MNVKVEICGNIFENLTSGHSECRPDIPERHPQEAYGMFSLEIEVAEVSGKNVHILSDLVGGNSRVDLCGLDIGVSEHL